MELRPALVCITSIHYQDKTLRQASVQQRGKINTLLTESDTVSSEYVHTDSRATERGGAATRNVGGCAGLPLACVCITTV